jgi:hypothetical protein
MSPKDAFYNTVHNAPGGHAALAIRLGMSAAVLRNKANVHSETNKPTLDDVDNIIGLTGDASVLHALAANHGYVCSKIAGAGCAADATPLAMVARIATRSADAVAVVNDALADGRLDSRELVEIRERAYGAIQALQDMVVGLEQTARDQREVANG